MAKVYIVIGSTGEYSDHTEWPVAAYFHKTKAEQHVQLADEAAKSSPRYLSKKLNEWVNPYDPGFCKDYTGTNYYIWEVEWRNAAPEKVET